MQILKFKCRIKKEVKFKITPHNANSQNNISFIIYILTIASNKCYQNIKFKKLL